MQFVFANKPCLYKSLSANGLEADSEEQKSCWHAIASRTSGWPFHCRLEVIFFCILVVPKDVRVTIDSPWQTFAIPFAITPLFLSFSSSFFLDEESPTESRKTPSRLSHTHAHTYTHTHTHTHTHTYTHTQTLLESCARLQECACVLVCVCVCVCPSQAADCQTVTPINRFLTLAQSLIICFFFCSGEKPRLSQ